MRAEDWERFCSSSFVVLVLANGSSMQNII